MNVHPSIATHPNVDQWLEFTADERIVVHTGKVDIGQRISTALAIIAAEELDVDYNRIDVKRTQTGLDPDEGFTAGSMSMQHSGSAIRLASATTRHYLIDLAANVLGLAPGTLVVDDGIVRSLVTGAHVSYWSLLTDKSLSVRIDETAPLKRPADYSWIGKAVIPKGLVDIVRGKTVFVHDLQLPQMLHSRVVRPPHSAARIESLDTTVIKDLKDSGVITVQDGSFLAVAATDEYRATKAAARLFSAIQWNLGSGIPTKDVFAALRSNAKVSLPVAEGGAPIEQPVSPLTEPPEEATITLTSTLEKPYLMHGSIGPSAACAVYENNLLTIYTHSQGVYPLRGAIAEALHLPLDTVQVTFMPGAGCYGHNGADDAAFDAALIALAVPGKPVLLKWTREEEHAWEPYGSAMVCELRASLDGNGKIIDWSHESYGDTFIMGRPAAGRTGSPASKLLSNRFRTDAPEQSLAQPAMGPHVGIHRNLEPLYTIPKPRLVKHLVGRLPFRTSALRTLGAFANIVAIESLIDQLADAAGVPPVEFRLQHLDDERGRQVLQSLSEQMAADAAGSSDILSQGIAFARYKNAAAYCAVGIELEVSEQANVRLIRAWVVADAGEIVDPAGITAQLEGGLIQAASWSLYETVTYDANGVTSRDWDTYPILRFNNVPHVHTLLIDRPGEPFLGAGEAVGGPTGGAIANAIRRATGLCVSRMPFNQNNIRAAALKQ